MCELSEDINVLFIHSEYSVILKYLFLLITPHFLPLTYRSSLIPVTSAEFGREAGGVVSSRPCFILYLLYIGTNGLSHVLVKDNE